MWAGKTYRASIKRKGTTSLGWPKAKLAVRLEDGRLPLFAGATGADAGSPSDHAVRAFDLNSLWWEPGENSYVREYVAFAAARAAGVAAPACRHVIVRLNGAFHGLYTLNERQDADWLKRVGLDARGGTLWKPKDGAWANLRPDAPAYAYPIAWEAVAGPKDVAAVARLAIDLAGRGAGRGRRAAALAADGASLAATVNYLAVYTVLLSQDRCSKNWYLLLEKGGAIWRLLPGDSKSALGSDSGLGGAPAKDYAIEHADQWASPLYCDANHGQDLEASAREPWSRLVAAPLTAGRRRRLAQAAASPTDRFSTYVNASSGCDAAFMGSPGGAAGTFNWGVDAILRCPPLRAAYLRRVASIMTLLHGGDGGGGGNSTGILRGIVSAATARVAAAAAADNDVWRGGDPARGAAQLLDEQIPRRAKALVERYGVERGSIARLIPAPQAADVQVDAAWDPTANSIVLSAPAGDAVDVSGWRVGGPAAGTLPPGAVIPPGGAVAIGRDPGMAKAPSGGPVLGFAAEEVTGAGKSEGLSALSVARPLL